MIKKFKWWILTIKRKLKLKTIFNLNVFICCVCPWMRRKLVIKLRSFLLPLYIPNLPIINFFSFMAGMHICVRYAYAMRPLRYAIFRLHADAVAAEEHGHLVRYPYWPFINMYANGHRYISPPPSIKRGSKNSGSL